MVVPSKKHLKNESLGRGWQKSHWIGFKRKSIQKTKSYMIDDNNNDTNINSNYSNFIQIVFLKVIFECVKTSCSFDFFENFILKQYQFKVRHGMAA